MRLLTYLSTLLISALVVACGGGDGSPGVSSGPNSTFAVAAPSAVTLQVGLSQPYAIKGGVKPYSVVSSDPAIAAGWIGGDDVLYVGTVVPGKATITTLDSKGSKVDIAVTVGSSTAFYTTAASNITITPGVAFARTYTLGGGTAPYVATSSFPSVATVSISGNQMTITGVQISTTAATITIRDAAGATLTTSVTVGTVPLTMNPIELKAPIGVIFRSVITGGTPPYHTVILDNCATNVHIVQGNILEATTALACEGAVITVVDANNQTVAVKFTVTAGTVGLQVAPSALTIPESPNTPDLSLLVYGANGPLQVFTTNTGVLAPQTPIKNADGTYTIVLTGGNTCYSGSGVDNTNPPNGTFTDLKGIPTLLIQPIDDVPPRPTIAITITVLDSTGRQGTSVLNVKDNGLGGVGCL